MPWPSSTARTRSWSSPTWSSTRSTRSLRHERHHPARARGVFALLEQTLTEQRQGEATAGGVRIEVLLDEPQHVRLPNNDDEIVARACELQQAIAPVQVTVLTGDNGMRARALAWGLEAEKLPEKYRIEQITARQKDEYLQTITAPEEPEPVSAS
ncbi:PIN domain-containing protein [Streptomyces hydrogenans]|uniref:PIN domain-containing protein n=1 Tax=Streptomyces hydrogenans TaxID=1873719 RepID=UPI001CFCC401|nr:PIN domain-containing protein [Streptomyces hydrogenans]